MRTLKIDEKVLRKYNACQTGIDWLSQQKTDDARKLFKLALKEKKFRDINWMLSRLMNKKQKVTYAIFAAEQVLDIYEKQHPNDDRPRKAIKAAKAYLKNPCKRTKKTADAAANVYAAAADADAAADAAANAYAAAAAADAAANAYAAAYAYADAAADAYADAAADAAAAAYAYADAAAAVKEKMYIKILKYGFNILTKEV
jgi:hypothetical protein